MAASIAKDLSKMGIGSGNEGVSCSACGKEKASKKCRKSHTRCKEERIH